MRRVSEHPQLPLVMTSREGCLLLAGLNHVELISTVTVNTLKKVNGKQNTSLVHFVVSLFTLLSLMALRGFAFANRPCNASGVTYARWRVPILCCQQLF